MSAYTKPLAASAPTGSKPSPRRQPIVPPRKPVDIASLRMQLTQHGGTSSALTALSGDVAANEVWKLPTDEQWQALSFADIPATAYDHLLQELLKGMLFETSRAADAELAKATSSNNSGDTKGSANGPRVPRTTSSRTVILGDEPTPLTAGPSSNAALLRSQSTIGAGGVALGVPSMYQRMHTAYNSVMANFAATEAERTAAAAALSGKPTAASNSSEGVSSAGTTPGPGAHPSAASSFSATLGQLCDRRVKQTERMLQASREESLELGVQLEDLRRAHEQVHQDLNRSYREYDKVQRQLLDLLDRERKREAQDKDEECRRRALADRQDERYKTKPVGNLVGTPREAAPGTDL